MSIENADGKEGKADKFDEEYWLREMAQWGSIILPDPEEADPDAEFSDPYYWMGEEISGGGLLTPEELEELSEAEKIAYRIRHSEEWNEEDYRELCELANLAEEFEEAQEDEEIDRVVARAAALLGIIFEP